VVPPASVTLLRCMVTAANMIGSGIPPSILVVEDEALIRMVTVDTLETLGFRVEEAGSATEAVDKVRGSSGGFDAVLIDMGLPDRKGDTLIGELRALEPSLRVVVASGYSQANLRSRVQADAATTFLGKPYDSRQLEAALRTLGVTAPNPSGT
jgi:CheY-like chemotaxis protein